MLTASGLTKAVELMNQSDGCKSHSPTTTRYEYVGLETHMRRVTEVGTVNDDFTSWKVGLVNKNRNSALSANVQGSLIS